MIEWIVKYYKILTGIAIPLIVALLGLFKVKSSKKLQAKIKGDKNNALIVDSNTITDSFNLTAQNPGDRSIQVIGDNNQISNLDISAVQALAQGFHQTMYPHLENALQKLRLNSQSFLAYLNSQLVHLSPSELEKFSEGDVQISLQNAIKSAARTASPEIHQFLGRLIADRVQKPKRRITELTINEAIEISEKLDVNLIKILAFNFLFSRTKYLSIQNLEGLISKLQLAINEFNDLDISNSKFEYLEAVSCGKIIPTIRVNNSDTSIKLINVIQQNYAHLFLKKISHQQLIQLQLNYSNFFVKHDDNTFELTSTVALLLYESGINYSNENSSLTGINTLMQRLKDFFDQHRLSSEEINTLIITRLPNFKIISRFWNEQGCARFGLTTVGVAIGRAYLEQKKLGNFDINLWVN